MIVHSDQQISAMVKRLNSIDADQGHHNLTLHNAATMLCYLLAERQQFASRTNLICPFGHGALGVVTGTSNGVPSVFITDVNELGVVGENVNTEGKLPRVILTFPTMEQAKAVQYVLCGKEASDNGVKI